MGTKANLKSISTPPSPSPPPHHHHKINNRPNFLVKKKETRNYVFLRVYMDQGLKEVKKNVLNV